MASFNFDFEIRFLNQLMTKAFCLSFILFFYSVLIFCSCGSGFFIAFADSFDAHSLTNDQTFSFIGGDNDFFFLLCTWPCCFLGGIGLGCMSRSQFVCEVNELYLNCIK